MTETICDLKNVVLNIGVKSFGPFTLEIKKGEQIAVLGPSGAGKTSLFRLLARDLSLHSGSFQMRGLDIENWSALHLSQVRAVLPQSSEVAFDLPTQLVIGLGRIALQNDKELDTIVSQAARMSRCDHLLGRRFDTLSGGEKVRVQIARIYAQLWSIRDGLILVDEPLASLDPGLQIELLGSLRQYAEERNHALVAILHDINQALQNFDRLILVKNSLVIGDMCTSIAAIGELEDLYGISLDSVDIGRSLPLVFPSIKNA